MPKGISIHIGLNKVDPNYYEGWDGQLEACVNDAQAMQSIASSCGYNPTLLLDEQATRLEVTKAINKAAQELASGDILLLTYAGHGSQVPDVNGDEVDGYDETWVLYDGLLPDDTMYSAFSQFSSGVRIVVFSDSCHSGSVLRMIYDELLSAKDSPIAEQLPYRRGKAPPKVRRMPNDIRDRVYQHYSEQIDTSQWAAGRGDRVIIGASAILISACQDNQLASDGDENGLFTGTLLDVWDAGQFTGSYYAFWKEIQERMPVIQSPNYYKVGQENLDFENQKPFTIDPTGSPVSSQKPSIKGPRILSRLARPPEFDVDPGANPFYAVEVTNDWSLFDFDNQGHKRNDSNFYAAWEHSALFSSNPYTLPQEAWDSLAEDTTHLYYRLWTSASDTEWVNTEVTTDDDEAHSAPFVTIIRRSGDGLGPPQTSTKPQSLTATQSVR